MSAGKIVEVLCLNGRRQKIKTTSSSTVLQVLKEACSKHGFNDAEIDLIHKRKVLDVTATITYSNIPNNGKLEMVKRNVPRKASQVQIALQTEFSERLQHVFDPSCSLLDVLKHWDGEPGSPYHGKIICKTPVIVYMTRQVSGMKNLKVTTLEKLGLIGGRAALRLTHKDEEDESSVEDTEMPESPSANSKIKDETSSDRATTSQSANVSQINDVTEPTATHSKEPESITTKESISVADRSDRETVEYKEPKEKKQKLADKSSPEKSDSRSFVQEISAVTTQSTISRPLQAGNDFKFPNVNEEQNRFIEAIQPVDPKKLMMEMKLSMPCNRNPIVFNCDRSGSSTTEYEEPSDRFFEVTVNEMRKLLLDQSLKSKDENPLMTKSMRETKEAEQILKHKQVIIRILFPDKIALQGIFRPLEPVAAVKEFVCEHLEDQKTKFDLYTTPPRCILKNLKQDLNSAKLIPSAVIRVSGERKSNSWLKQELIDSAATYIEADLAANNVLKKYDGRDVSTEASRSSNVPTRDDIPLPKQQVSSNDSRNPTKPKQSGEKVPKWFMQGKR